MSAARDTILAAIARIWALGADTDLPYWEARAAHHDRVGDLYQKLSDAPETSAAERLALLDAISYRRREADSARQHHAAEVAGSREGADR